MSVLAFTVWVYGLTGVFALAFYEYRNSIEKEKMGVEIVRLTSSAKQRMPAHEEYSVLKERVDEHAAKLNALAFRAGIKTEAFRAGIKTEVLR